MSQIQNMGLFQNRSGTKPCSLNHNKFLRHLLTPLSWDTTIFNYNGYLISKSLFTLQNHSNSMYTQCIRTYSFQSFTCLKSNPMDSDIFVSIISIIVISKGCILNQPDSSYKITQLTRMIQRISLIPITFQGLL